MSNRQPRFDGLGIVLLGVGVIATIGFAVASGLRPTAPLGDTDTQISMSLANWLMAWVSLVAAAIGAVTLLLLRLTWLEARQTRLETIRIGEAQTRAYIVVADSVITESFPPDYWNLAFQFRNSGQTPAVKIRTEMKVWFEIAIPTGWQRISDLMEHEERPRSDLASQSTTQSERKIYTLEMRHAQEMNKVGAVRADLAITYFDVFGTKQTTLARFRATFTPFNGPLKTGTPMMPIGEEEA